MHPAPSIIIFTVFSGLGFGLLTFLGFGKPDVSGFTAFVFFLIAYAMAVGGLVSSTFHLGHPERALKAFTQWRSSWLSREGVLSVAALLVMGLYALGVIFFNTRLTLLGWVGGLLSLSTVLATSMIYGQLKTVPRWNHWSTPLLFVLYSLTGGAFFAGQVKVAMVLLLLLGIAQLIAWMLGDKLFEQAGSTIETATGLGRIGKVRLFESPHTGGNYLTREMIHIVGRKHAAKLRILAIIALVVVPFLALAVLPFSHLLGAVAAILHVVGALMTRWLFFAQAEHTVGLYYDAR